ISQGIAWTPFLGDGPQPQKHELPKQSFATVHDVGFWVDLTRTNIPALVEEPFMPPTNMMRMRVYFYYQQNLKMDDYWKSEGKFWNKEVEEFVGKNHGIGDAVSKIAPTSDAPEQKVRKIYSFIGSLENLDYLPERTKQENKTMELKQVKGADDVLENHG